MQFRRLFLTITALLNFSLPSFAQQPTILRLGGAVRTVKFSPVDASLVASAGADGTVKLWNLQNDTVTTLRGHTRQVNSVAFSPNGKLLASGSDDYKFKLWDVQNRQPIVTLEHVVDHTRYQIKAVAFSPDGQLLATAGWGVKLWDVSNQNGIDTLEHDQWVYAVAFSRDGQRLAAGDINGLVKVWDVQNWQAITQLEGDTTVVYSVAFSPDGRTLASAGYQGQIRLWAVANWELLGTLHNRGTAYTVDFSLDGEVLASTGHETVSLWSVENGEKIATLTGHTGWVYGVAFSPDGTAIASGGDDRTVRVQNIESHLQTRQQREMIRLIYFLPRGRSRQHNIDTKLDMLIRDVQQFFAEQMQINGFGRKTFTFEADADSALRVHRVDGKFGDRYYHTNTYDKVTAEISEQFDRSKHVYLIAADVSSERIGHENVCGRGGGRSIRDGALNSITAGGTALIPASGDCFDGPFGVNVAAHELGHTFGLGHDFRNDAYLMSYGSHRTQLSQCAAEWLDVHRIFNSNQIAFNEPATIQMLPPLAYPSNAISLRFKITDTDGLHQAQLLTPSTAEDQAPGFLKLLSCKRLNGESNTFEFITTELTIRYSNEVTLQVIDVYGNITRGGFTFRRADILPAPKDAIPTTLAKISGDDQHGAPGATLANPLIVKVTDQDGSALEGIAVTFAVTAGGGTLSATTVTTGADGRAETTLTLGSRAGTNTVEVSVAEIQQTLAFNAEGIRSSDTNATVSVSPSPVPSPAIGDQLTLSLNITNGENVAGYQATVTFDTAALRFVSSDNADYLPQGAFAVPAVVSENTVTLAATSLAGESNGDGTLATLTFEVVAVKASTLTLSHVVLSDSAGAASRPQVENGQVVEPPQLVGDVNRDGAVNIQDLVLVGSSLGQTGQNDADVNGDAVVNIQDLVLVAAAFGNAATAPSAHRIAAGMPRLRAADVHEWLAHARQLDLTDATSQRGIIFLEHLLAALTPKDTVLLPNYPNPFNPETWIPYHLAQAADVTLTVYDTKGTVVRQLNLGHQSAGFYTARNRAAYWDGTNERGETVASGVYVYELRAGEYSALRRMVILK